MGLLLSTKYVLMNLALEADDRWLCLLSVSELAGKMQVPTSTVCKHISKLKKEGLIVAERQEKKRGRSFRYRLTLRAQKAF